MECPLCKSENPAGKKFCGDCGNLLEQSITATIDSKISESVDAALEQKLKEFKQTEFELTENIANRILGWSKTALSILGIPIVVLGGFGLKGVWDIDHQRDEIEKLGATQKEAIGRLGKDQIAQVQTQLETLHAQIDPIKKSYADLGDSLGSLQKIRDDLNDLAANQRQNDERLNAVEKLAGYQPVPKPTGTTHLDLEKVIGSVALQKLRDSGSLTFQTVGATGGVRDSSFQTAVAEQMNKQIQTGDVHKPAFLYLLGNIVFYNGETDHYYDQFYKPYNSYAAPIFAIPGNHDGEPATPQQRSLDGFLRTFCAPTPIHQPEAGTSDRQAMTEPNVYWTLDTPFATIIGLYTNVPSKGAIDADQADWLRRELRAAPLNKAVLVMLNHPPYSMDSYHSGSARISGILDNAIRSSGREPDAVFSADVFNYQRFTLRRNGRESLYFIAGVGGYPLLHNMPPLRVPMSYPDVQGLTLQTYAVEHGFVQITVSATALKVQFVSVQKTDSGSTAMPLDSVTLDLRTHKTV